MRSRLTLVATIVVALVASGCTAAGSSSPPAQAGATSVPTAMAEPTAAVTMEPTPAGPPLDILSAHINSSVDELIGLTDDADIMQWMKDEGNWLIAHADLAGSSGMNAYRDSVLAGLQAIVDESDIDLAVTGVVAAAEAVPSVQLTAVAPTPEPTPDIAHVGERLVFTSGDDDSSALYLRIVRVANWKSTNQFTKPDAGNKFIVVDVLFEGMSGEIEARAGEFTVTDADGYVYEISPMWKETSLPYDISLRKGKKVRGWLTFEVPKTLKTGWIVYADTEIAFTSK